MVHGCEAEDHKSRTKVQRSKSPFIAPHPLREYTHSAYKPAIESSQLSPPAHPSGRGGWHADSTGGCRTTSASEIIDDERSVASNKPACEKGRMAITAKECDVTFRLISARHVAPSAAAAKAGIYIIRHCPARRQNHTSASPGG